MAKPRSAYTGQSVGNLFIEIATGADVEALSKLLHSGAPNYRFFNLAKLVMGSCLLTNLPRKLEGKQTRSRAYINIYQRVQELLLPHWQQPTAFEQGTLRSMIAKWIEVTSLETSRCENSSDKAKMKTDRLIAAESIQPSSKYRYRGLKLLR